MATERQAPESVRVESGRFQTHLAASRVSAGRAALVLWLGLVAMRLWRSFAQTARAAWFP